MAAERLAIKDLSELPPNGAPVMQKGALRVMKERYADRGCLQEDGAGLAEFHAALKPDPGSVRKSVRASLETLRAGDEYDEVISGEVAASDEDGEVPVSIDYLRLIAAERGKGEMDDVTRESILEQAVLDLASGKMTESEFAVISEHLASPSYRDRMGE